MTMLMNESDTASKFDPAKKLVHYFPFKLMQGLRTQAQADRCLAKVPCEWPSAQLLIKILASL